MPLWQDEYWPRSKKIYIGGLPAKATSNEVSGPNGNLKINKISFQLEAAFNCFGKIRKIWIAQRPPGFAFIEFEERCDAEGFFFAWY